MSRRVDLSTAVDNLTAAVNRLRLSLTEGSGSQGSVSDFEVVSVPEPSAPVEEPPTTSRLQVGSSEWEAALQAATTAEELLALDLGPVEPLLQTARIESVRQWTPLARLAVAYRAGRGDRAVQREIENHRGESIALPLRASYFVVLRCPKHPGGFWTRSSRTYFVEVGDPTGRGQVDPTTICRAFASKIEVTAYLLAAERPWPQYLASQEK